MAVKKPDLPRPDHTRSIVGHEGDRVHQESGSGKQVIRRGGDAGESDIDVATQSSPHDLIGDGDFESGQRTTGGAEAIAGDLLSADSNTFSVEIDWMDDDGNVLKTHDPSALADVTDVDFNVIVRSDHFEVRITDTSGAGQNQIHGSVNAH